jgi:cell division GTPase FtsZ
MSFNDIKKKKYFNNPLIVGIGGSGQAIVRDCVRNSVNADYVIVDNTPHDFAMPFVKLHSRDPEDYKDKDEIDDVDFHEKVRHVYLNYKKRLEEYSETAMNNMEFDLSDLKNLKGFETYDLIILVNGLGGKFGTPIARKYFNDLSTLNKQFYWIYSYPLPFEGRERWEFAKSFTKDIPGSSRIITLDNKKNVLAEYKQTDAFNILNTMFVRRIREILEDND